MKTSSFRILPSTLIVALFSLPFFVHAETALRVGDSVSISADQRVEEDFYGAGGIVTMSGEIVGDMNVVGGSVTINGPVGADLGVMGGSVQIHGPITDDVRVVGGDVTIADAVGGDVFVMGGSLSVLSSATIKGDIFFFGAEAEINGAVEGSVSGTAERVRIDAPVGQDVEVTTSRPLVLGERASIKGNISYTSFGELVRAQNAVVEGTIVQNEPSTTSSSGTMRSLLTGFVVHLFALLCIYLGFKTELSSFIRGANLRIGRNALVGIGGLVVVPVILVILMVTFLGIFLGLIGLFAFLGTLFLSYVLSAAVIGGFISRLVTRRIEVTPLWLVAGVISVQVLFLIPVIGPLCIFLASGVAFGQLTWQIYRSFSGHEKQ